MTTRFDMRFALGNIAVISELLQCLIILSFQALT
jgi:hypothetical protein